MNLRDKRKQLYLALAVCALSNTAALFHPLYLYALGEAREPLQNAARAQAALVDWIGR
ncbi:MAG: hypothetical protein V3S64_07605 [bacterium]